MDEILDFIKHFSGSEDTFLHGFCWWFAWILKERFNVRGWFVEIMYDPVPGHFVAKFMRPDLYDFDTHFFDIRGDVTVLYKQKWKDQKLYYMDLLEEVDPAHYAHLMRDCRDFIDPEKASRDEQPSL